MNSIIYVFAVLGLLVFTGVVLYYISKSLQKVKPAKKPTWPSEEYMEKIGTACPTGWINIGEDGNQKKYKCQNYYNIPVANDKCYDDSTSKYKSFTKITDWKKCEDENCSALKERCKWVKSCGIPADPTNPNSKNNPSASWIGIMNHC